MLPIVCGRADRAWRTFWLKPYQKREFSSPLGAVYALFWNSSVSIEKLYLEIISLNDNYPEIFITYEDNSRIIRNIVGTFIPIEQ